jgi:hypothetical protein
MSKRDTGYSDAMIEAFIDKPSETLWYQNAFKIFDAKAQNSSDWQWHWSWWAFGTGFLFLLYRKQYIPSLILFLLSSLMSFIPVIGGILSMVLAGGYSSYFVYKGYKTKLQEVEKLTLDEAQRVEMMRELGGYHEWVIWLYIILTLLIGYYLLTTIISLLAVLPH